MNFDASRKNYTGLAFVAVLHLVAAVIALKHSTIMISHADPAEVTLVPTETAPPPQVDPIEPPEFPRTRVPVITPPILDEPLPLGPTLATDLLEPHDSSAPGPAGPGRERIVDAEAARRAPVNIAAVIDAASCAKPAYPAAALRNGDEGTVTLAFLVGKDGRVASARVERTSGHRDLDRAALQGLSMCAFRPGSVDGVAQESWARMQYAWRLDE